MTNAITEKTENMFYEGDLQSGIAKAVQESKLVACFVTDDGEESSLWENIFLQEPSVQTALANQTILLRLIAGSQEAGYLAAIFPLPKTPTLVIIENGQLKEYLNSGITQDEFVRRIGVVFTSRVTPSVPVASSNVDESATLDSREPSTSSPPPTGQSSQNVQNLLAERKARLEAHKKEQEAQAKAAREADAQMRKEALEATPDAQKSSDMKYALMQKKRQQEARDERARILKLVEDDKAERKNREAQRKSDLLAKKEAIVPTNVGPSSSSSSNMCAIQVRLFDGSTIRNRFPAEATLSGAVRPWVDEQLGADIPYNFKHVLTPLPNKNIAVSEEEKSLKSQGLAPSATLIITPVQGAISAYESSGPISLVSRGVSTGFGLLSSGAGLVTGALGGLLGVGATPLAPSNVAASPSSSPSANINVRTLRDQDRPDEQFYNGNALNFEPRKDEDDKKQD